MAKTRSNKPILPGPFIMAYHLGAPLPGDLPNEIIFIHPVTKARAVYVVHPGSVIPKDSAASSGS
jgi:hypothetical protein